MDGVSGAEGAEDVIDGTKEGSTDDKRSQQGTLVNVCWTVY